MSRIPLFDTLTHPTLSGQWLSSYPRDASLNTLLADMRSNCIKWAFAVGMKGIGDYDLDLYSDLIGQHRGVLFPVAFFDPNCVQSRRDIHSSMKKIASRGYMGIKIHPRISRIFLDNPMLELSLKEAAEQGLLAFLCTHLIDAHGVYRNRFEVLVHLLERVRDVRIVLLHGGLSRVLELVLVAKAIGNKLVDLSYTITKFEGSSLDLDIRYLFANCDRSICIGSDHPEYQPSKLRERFEFFSGGIQPEQARNIAYLNIATFANLSLGVC